MMPTHTITPPSLAAHTMTDDARRGGVAGSYASTIALGAPVVLIFSTLLVFLVAAAFFGSHGGVLVGFLFYWLVWGLAFPRWFLGPGGIAQLFAPVRSSGGLPAWVAFALLAVPPVAGFLFVFPALYPSATGSVVVASAAIALVNGTLEEVFWRGTFLRAFPRSPGRGVVYPAIAFGVWHLVPLSVSAARMPGGVLAFVAMAIGFGLIYGLIAWRTASIRWTAMSHVLMNMAGLGALIYFTARG